MMYRRNTAQTRLTTALDALKDRLGIDDLSIPLTGKDPELLAVMQLEAMADVAEAVNARLTDDAPEKKAPAKPAPNAKAVA